MTPRPWRLTLSLQAILMQASWVGVRLLVGYRALGEGASPLFLGVVAASFALPALVTALPVGRLADRFGGTIISFVGILTVIIGTATLILISGIAILLAASAVIGLGHLCVMVGQQTFVAHRSAHESSDSAFGTLSAAASIGQLVGPPVVTMVVALANAGQDRPYPDTTAGFLATITCAVLATPLYAIFRPIDRDLKQQRSAVTTARESPRTVLATPGMWRSLLVSGAVLVTVDLMYTFVPVWATEQNISVVAVGWLLALRAAVSVLSRLGLTRLVSRFGRRVLLLVAISAAILSLIALPLVGVPGAIGVMIGLGIGLGLPQPLTMAWVVGLTNPAYHGAALGLRMTTNRFAQITIPIAVSAAAAPLGVAGIFWANAAILAGSIFIVARSDPGP